MKSNRQRFLISFGRPRMGCLLLRLVHLLNKEAEIQAIHFATDPAAAREEIAYSMAESFDRIKSLAEELGTEVRFLFREATNITEAIVRHTIAFEPDWLFLGAAGLLALEDPLGGRVGEILQQTSCSVGVVVDRGPDRFNQFLLLPDEIDADKLADLFAVAADKATVEIRDPGNEAPAIISDERQALTVMTERLWRSSTYDPAGSVLILNFRA